MRISLGTKFQLTPTVLISFLQNLPKKFARTGGDRQNSILMSLFLLVAETKTTY